MPQARHWLSAIGICALVYAIVLMICALDDACALVHMVPLS